MTIPRPFKTTYDWDYMEKVLRRETTEGPVPLIELFPDAEIMSEVTGIDYPSARAVELSTNTGQLIDDREALDMGIRLMDLSIAFSKAVGYDYVTMIPIVPLTKTRRELAADDDPRRQKRAWKEEGKGIITSRAEYEEYKWPALDQISLLPLDYAAGCIPTGMKIMVMYNGIYEDLSELMGTQQMAIKSIEEPDLVEDIIEQLTRIAAHAVGLCAAHPGTGAIFYSDDLGFKGGTILSPRFLRKYYMPRLKRISDACHRHGKLFLLHSCGQVMSIMDDLINAGIDARHSFEDTILPVEQWYDKFHDRLAILGGVDMDLMANGTAEQVAQRTRRILEHCAPGGGYCMGTGNSVANYVRIENYYAMIDETRKWNVEHGF
ncbi:MAG: uroporphyrinogen decarboxylase family protein [Dehalococcoidia bacterium]|jgi:uroporphyrinogen decarboxylase